MRLETGQALVMILLSAGITVALRTLPFLIFRGGRKMPDTLRKLAQTLPPAIMAVLVIYGLKAVPTQGLSLNLVTFAAVAVVVAVHLWKRNTIFSVFAGTACYMLLLRMVG